MRTREELQCENRLLRRMVKLADGVMEYCQGDAWERECTEVDRKKFDDLYTKVFK